MTLPGRAKRETQTLAVNRFSRGHVAVSRDRRSQRHIVPKRLGHFAPLYTM